MNYKIIIKLVGEPKAGRKLLWDAFDQVQKRCICIRAQLLVDRIRRTVLQAKDVGEDEVCLEFSEDITIVEKLGNYFAEESVRVVHGFEFCYNPSTRAILRDIADGFDQVREGMTRRVVKSA